MSLSPPLRPAKSSAKNVTSKPRVVIALDLDCFYASVAIRDRPELQDKPVAVTQKHLCVTTNYVARSAANGAVKKMTPISEAKKRCPSLILIDGSDLAPFRAANREVVMASREFLAQYAAEAGVPGYDIPIERLGLDELFVDMTELCGVLATLTDYAWRFCGHVIGNECDTVEGRAFMVASQIAEKLRAELVTRTRLTSCCGVASSKLLAKLACSAHKPNDQTIILSDAATSYVMPLPPTALPGIGRTTSDKLQEWARAQSRALETAGDVVNAFSVAGGIAQLRGVLGHIADAERVLALCCGEDNAPVVDDGDAPKSISVEDACRDCDNMSKVRLNMTVLASRLMRLLVQDIMAFKRRPASLTIGHRFRADGFKSTWRCIPIPPEISLLCTSSPPPPSVMQTVEKGIIIKSLAQLKEQAGISEGETFQITLLGMGVCNFSDKSKRQVSCNRRENIACFFLKTNTNAGLQTSKTKGVSVVETNEKNYPPSKDCAKSTNKTLAQCPICNATLSLNNLLMNRHIDRCVGFENENQQSLPKRARTAEKTRRVDSFFSKR